jgi:hypothetical protein
MDNALDADHTQYCIRQSSDSDVVDEIDNYWNARYLSAGEAAWRTLGYAITHKRPSVTPLPVHLPYSDSCSTDTKSLLQHYFARPLGQFRHRGCIRAFDDITYKEYYTLFRIATYDPLRDSHDNYFTEHTAVNAMHVILRTAVEPHFTRLHHVRPSAGDRFYLRSLLQFKPARSYDDLLTVNGMLHDNFQMAAMAHGLFQTMDSESNYALSEAVSALYTPPQLRTLFIHLLVNDCIDSPIRTWEKFRTDFSFDFTIQHRDDPAYAENKTLQHLSHMLEEYGKTLSDFGLQEPTCQSPEVEHELERWRPHAALLRDRASHAVEVLNHEQLHIYNHIMSGIINDNQLLSFIDGKAGCGKTFLVNAICDSLRAQNRIVLPTATSAFAAQLYPGGRTTHSTFKVRINDILLS